MDGWVGVTGKTTRGSLRDRMLKTALSQLCVWARAFVRVAQGVSPVKSCSITIVAADALGYCDAVLAGRQADARYVVCSSQISCHHLISLCCIRYFESSSEAHPPFLPLSFLLGM